MCLSRIRAEKWIVECCACVANCTSGRSYYWWARKRACCLRPSGRTIVRAGYLHALHPLERTKRNKKNRTGQQIEESNESAHHSSVSNLRPNTSSNLFEANDWKCVCVWVAYIFKRKISTTDQLAQQADCDSRNSKNTWRLPVTGQNTQVAVQLTFALNINGTQTKRISDRSVLLYVIFAQFKIWFVKPVKPVAVDFKHTQTGNGEYTSRSTSTTNLRPSNRRQK